MNAPYLLGPFALLILWFAAVLAMSATGAVVAERASYGLREWRRRRFEAHYAPLVARALSGDAAAECALVEAPRAFRLDIATLLVAPLVADRDPTRIARTREIVRAMSLLPDADRMARSLLWWRRAIALRALGLLQMRERTAVIVAALDDDNPDVRAAALDALADLRDPGTLAAVVVRLFDATLPRGRRVAALAAFGADAERLLLDLAEVHPPHRAGCALALALCGTAASRPELSRWARDGRPAERAAAFKALAHVGLDGASAAVALDALDAAEPVVRAAAARALQGWAGSPDTAARLARHLDDDWTVATEAARSLQSIGPAGHQALLDNAVRTDLAGLLARQMVWEAQAPS
jgi:HEAT repeats